jgi:hypothetical protein
MKQLIKRLLFLLLASWLIFFTLDAQQKHITSSAKKKQQVEQAYKKAYAKARKRTIQHRYDIQTKATQERMDAARKRSEAFNRQNDPGFLERIFKKKRPKTR